MGNGLAEGALTFRLCLVDVYPLVVERCVGKHIDALLAEFHIVAHAQLLTFVLLKVLIGIDNYFAHIFCCFMVYSVSCCKGTEKIRDRGMRLVKKGFMGIGLVEVYA